MEQAGDSWSFLWIDVEATRDKIKDETQLILAVKDGSLSESSNHLESDILLSMSLARVLGNTKTFSLVNAVLIELLSDFREEELLGIFLSEKSRVRHVLEALDQVLEAQTASLLVFQRTSEVE